MPVFIVDKRIFFLYTVNDYSKRLHSTLRKKITIGIKVGWLGW